MGIEPKGSWFWGCQKYGQKGDCMNRILLSTQECGSQELLQLTEMLCREQDFQIIVSRAFPFMEKERKKKLMKKKHKPITVLFFLDALIRVWKDAFDGAQELAHGRLSRGFKGGLRRVVEDEETVGEKKMREQSGGVLLQTVRTHTRQEKTPFPWSVVC